MSQLLQVAKPGVMKIVRQHFFLLACLRVVPIEVGSVDIVLQLPSYTSHGTTGNAHQHAVGGEERHLCVVAD